MGAVIRPADDSDLAGIVAVGHRTWPATYEPIAGADYVAMGLAKWWTEESTTPAIRAGRALVAVVDGEVVGVAVAGPSDGHLVLWKLYVVPEHQGEGLGSRLLAAVVDRASGHHHLRVAYLDGNDSAAAFYRSHGFVELEREVSGHGIPDALWLQLEIEPPDGSPAAHGLGSAGASA